MTLVADVAVVGAGLCGLAAARRLVAGGAEVMVLEAKPRVGGRTRNDVLPDGSVVDAGAMYVCEGQDAILGLADELGVERYPSYGDGASVMVREGVRTTFDGALPDVGEAVAAEVQEALRSFGRLAATVPLGKPWEAPDAEELDATSLAAWRDGAVPSDTGRFLMDVFLSGWPCVDPAEVSLLHLLHHVQACGGLRHLMATQSQTYRFAGGSQLLSTRMREELGDRVLSGVPVVTIRQTGDSVLVEGTGIEVRAQQVVVSVNPAGCRQIRFDPPLPVGRQRFQDCWTPGLLRKVNVVYDEPFWRGEGLSGAGYTDLPAAPSFLDACPPDSSLGVLAAVSFVLPEGGWKGKGNPAAFHGDPAFRRSAVLDALATAFGPRAREPLAFIEGDWPTDPFTFGCEGSTPPGLITEVGAAAEEPFGRVTWAGTDTAHSWPGWMNGAVDAGQRAAAEVLATL